ncbi:hypothetical protein ABG067_006803 [Albugo candida]
MKNVIGQIVEETLSELEECVLVYITSIITEQLEETLNSTHYHHLSASDQRAHLCQVFEPLVLPFIVESNPLSANEEQSLQLFQRLLQKLLEADFIQSHNTSTLPREIRTLENAQSIEEIARHERGMQETTALMDRMWGFDRIRKTTNAEMESQLSTQSARQVRKQQKMDKISDEKEQLMAQEDADWENTRVLPDLSKDTGEKDIHVHQLTINFKGKTLLADAALKLSSGRRYGLIGKNGAGKTTLLRFISHYEIENFPRHVRIQHVEQESASKLSLERKSVIEVVLEADYERHVLLKEEQELLAGGNQSKDSSTRLKQIYDRLVEIEADSAETRARSILKGLQFSDSVLQGPACALSGGWRMRTALAGALFMSPDLLLLDEPTNHLDLEAVIWLEHYLEKYDKTMIVVSHDRKFLNAICTDIIHLANQKLTYYKGDYNTFERTMKENLRQQRKAFEAQQMKIKHMQDFIDRFRANAKKAPLVQSRVKALDKILRTELIEEPEDARAFRMHFPPPEPLGRPVVAVDGISFRYNAESPLLFDNVHMGIDLSSRIGILGVNGSGKSTLINIVLGKLQPTSGTVTLNPRLRISTFTQHHIDSLDLAKSAVENMRKLYPGHENDEFRNHLGRFNLSGDLAMKPTRTLSGGQKSRVGFAIMTWRLPHLVVLDEPTNHLDMETIDALIDALRDYKGGVMIVSHDQHFVNSVCQELWVVENRQVARFEGSIVDYKNRVLK